MSSGDKRDAYLDHLRERVAPPVGSESPQITVAGLLETCPDLHLHPENGESGLLRSITAPLLYQAGLALAGFDQNLLQGAVAVLGAGEYAYLQDQPVLIDAFREAGTSCFLCADCENPANLPEDLCKQAKAEDIAVLTTAHTAAFAIYKYGMDLQRALAPQTTLHAGLVAYRGLGILILGKSGIGKTDIALNLIKAGGCLVADDVVVLRRDPLSRIIGSSKGLIRQHMHVRGVGILDINRLMGPQAVLDETPVDLLLYLQDPDAHAWAHMQPISDLSVLGETLPLLHMPMAPGRNQAHLVETAIHNFILSSRTGESAQNILTDKLNQQLDQDADSGGQ